MAIGLVGKKCGMTRVFQEDGSSIPVTVIEVEPNRITQIKTDEIDGYKSIQITIGARRPSRVTKPLAGHYAKANVSAGRGLWEFRIEDGDKIPLKEGEELKLGSEITVAMFKDGQVVDVVGITKGKGFAGVIKRYNFCSQDASHGNSLSHRAPGSIGQRQTPGRVFKGKKMAGHLGDVRCTIQNQELVKVDSERNLLFVKGVVPGAPGGNVIVLPACKKRARKEK